ncbi:MAG: hypothetical protein IT464_13700 [Planctomycetes bacterium]|nr:hypothetical protein [Planctomycetota bacterium]
MKRLAVFLLTLLAACQTPAGNADDGATDGTIDTNTHEQPQIVLERDEVMRFRGTEMPDLLERMDSDDPDQWLYVRRHVHPQPLPPLEFKDGNVAKVNYDWPPADWKKLNARQKAWRSYVLWPEHVRGLLQQERLVDTKGQEFQKAWDSAEVRTRLARYGRMYRIVYKFQSAPQYANDQRESEHWRQFAESLLAYGDDGRELLVSNMILALTSPNESVIYKAQGVLIQVGQPAIEKLCTALWTGHNQLVEAQDAKGETIYVVQTNANFPKYVIETLYQIGPRSVPQAIYELENTLDPDGEAKGTAWRFRKSFIELLGRFTDKRAIRALDAEITRVKIFELDRVELAKGKRVVDQEATDHATYVFREYLLQAIGNIGAVEGLRPVLRIWKLDDFHEVSAVDAILKITNRRVRTLSEARELAKQLKVDLQGE